MPTKFYFATFYTNVAKYFEDALHERPRNLVTRTRALVAGRFESYTDSSRGGQIWLGPGLDFWR